MRTVAQTQSKSKIATVVSYSGLLQRQCACGQHTVGGGECEECSKKKSAGMELNRSVLPHRAADSSTPDAVPPIVYDVLRSPGQPLDADTRAFFESRFDSDFSGIRIHSDAQAAVAARSISAEAFAVGNHVFFEEGRFHPNESAGRGLLAHELTHTLQQEPASSATLTLSPQSSQQEAEAAAMEHRLTPAMGPVRMPVREQKTAGTIKRKVKVNNPGGVPSGAPPGETNEKIVRAYVASLCPSFTVGGGELAPSGPAACLNPAAGADPEACGCLCEMHGLAAGGAPVTWSIDVNDSDWPHTDPGTKVVTVHSPYSGVQFGSWAKGPPTHRVMEDNWLVLGHELCGHARLFARGTHPTSPPDTAGGRPSHDPTVEIEHKIAAEHGTPASELRGLFRDPHHGESLSRVTVAKFDTKSANLSTTPVAERHKLDIAKAFMDSAPVTMDLVGHTDQQGSAAQNSAVSQQRAVAVKRDLTGKGIDPARFISVKGVGASECASPGDQPLCRKVDIFMFSYEGASITRP